MISPPLNGYSLARDGEALSNVDLAAVLEGVGRADLLPANTEASTDGSEGITRLDSVSLRSAARGLDGSGRGTTTSTELGNAALGSLVEGGSGSKTVGSTVDDAGSSEDISGVSGRVEARKRGEEKNEG